jgi:hypothetical protein
MNLPVAWCDACQHSHNVGAPCVTECVDCEEELIEETEAFLRDEAL